MYMTTFVSIATTKYEKYPSSLISLWKKLPQYSILESSKQDSICSSLYILYYLETVELLDCCKKNNFRPNSVDITFP